jgi:hypothetical protein
MAYAGLGFGGSGDCGRRSGITPARRHLRTRGVRRVDDDVFAVERVGQALADECVYPGLGKHRYRFVVLLLESGYEFGADESGAADDDDLDD